jgi:phosphoglycolate phosphatase
VGQAVFDAAIASVVGTTVEDHGVHMSGKTDPQIALEILSRVAISDDEARDHLPGILQALERELEAAVDAIREHGRVHPGIRELLDALAREPGVTQSVLTGNLAATARLKVSAFGLERWLDLDVGAYGSDHQDRRKLVPVAMERASRLRGLRLRPSDAWVVGDTPADLACARAGGARCLLVATGRIPIEDLRAARPDAVLPDLCDTDRARAIVLGHEAERSPLH